MLAAELQACSLLPQRPPNGTLSRQLNLLRTSINQSPRNTRSLQISQTIDAIQLVQLRSTARSFRATASNGGDVSDRSHQTRVLVNREGPGQGSRHHIAANGIHTEQIGTEFEANTPFSDLLNFEHASSWHAHPDMALKFRAGRCLGLPNLAEELIHLG